jgi:hypothetical protein
MYISIHIQEMEGGCVGPGKTVRLRKWGYASLVVCRRGVDPGAYGKGEHLIRRDRDQAAMPPERGAEGRFFLDGFRTGVDETVADCRVFRP